MGRRTAHGVRPHRGQLGLHRFIHKTGGAAYNLDDLAISAVFKLWTQAAAAGDTKSSHFGVVSWWAGFENFILK